MPDNLRAGEFFGQVPQKRSTLTAVMTEVVHSIQTSVPKHSHELGHFQLLVKGSYLETCGGKSVQSAPMTISWHRPNMTHMDEIGPGGGRFFMIEIEPCAISRFEQFAKLPNDFYVRNHPLVSLAGRLYREFRIWDIGSDLITEGMTLEMLAHLARTSLAIEKRPPLWLRRAVEKLNEEFTEELSTSGLAAAVDVHPVHLAAVFRRFYHETVGEYVQRLRVERASVLLRDSRISLAEIAQSVGFSDQSHFTRIFKRHVGITPGAFRSSL
jgi:AraC family transcriptional regulator